MSGRYMQKIIITSNGKGIKLNLKELLSYKELFLILAYRDFKVRYAQTFLGFLWAFLQPAATLIIFILIFSKAIRIDTGNIPYPLFVTCGLLAWSYFSFVMSQAGNSIINAQQMVKKIYFPRLIIPLSKAMIGLIEAAVVFLILIILMIIYNSHVPVQVFLFPLYLLLLIITSLGLGIWLSALSIRYRDFQHIIPFMIQLGMYATPVAYPARIIPPSFQFIYYLNPIAGVIEGFRWTLLDSYAPQTSSYFSYCIGLLLFLTSLYYFKKTERVMADLI
jgi:lipopolysaccharide transport system permease protein